jgi:DNA invertase Pin-like site-specific DNA recombinase
MALATPANDRLRIPCTFAKNLPSNGAIQRALPQTSLPVDSITLQVLGAVAKLERPLIAERNAAQRLSIPPAIRSEHLGSPSTGIS